MKKHILSIFILIILCVECVYAGPIGDLRTIAASQDDAQRVYREETNAFNRVKAAVDHGDIKKGQLKKDIKSLYGEPIVNTSDFDTGRDKWIYKPAKSSFFAGVRVYLYFDRDNKLDEIKVVE
jgi:hypothetical protein